MTTSDIQTIRKTRGIVGEVRIPGDKSVAHRCALFASIGDGTSRIVNYPASADPQSTLSCVRSLGIPVYEDDDGILVVEGGGLHGWQAPETDLDCGNSGTTMRLMAGMLAGRGFDSRLIGDASLQSRPMERIASPLREMGARLELSDGRAPMGIQGSPLRGITYRLPVASAQVKSAVLLAGMMADGETTVVESQPSRDHTERMLGLPSLDFGSDRHITISGGHRVPTQTWAVPGDFSAAAFFLVAGSIVPESHLRIPSVGMNASRTGLLDVLRAMGAQISVTNERVHGGEPMADLEVRSAELSGIHVGGAIIPNLIDEIPILAVAGTMAAGTMTIRDAGELRVKEADRIDAMVTGLRAMGAHVDEHEDGMTIHGGAALSGTVVEARHDHRIAMAMAVAGLVARGTTTIRGASAAAVSFPEFWSTLRQISV